MNKKLKIIVVASIACVANYYGGGLLLKWIAFVEGKLDE